jgi:hypothetical protein
MICPKCGFEQPDALECARCGIIIAKYKPRQETPAFSEQTGASPSPPAPPPPEASDPAPGWSRAPESAAQGQGVLGSRYTTYDRDQFRRAQAHEATRKFIMILAIAAGAVLILVVFVSFFSVYNNFMKLEMDVNDLMGHLYATTPPAVKKSIMDKVKERGFKIKGGDFEMQIRGADGADIAELTEKIPENMVWNLEAKVEFDVEGKAIGFFPITLAIRSSAPFTVRDTSAHVRSWMGLDPLPAADKNSEANYNNDYYDDSY